jgi:hypothetical protein
MRKILCAVAVVVLGALPSAGRAQWPTAGHPRQGQPGMPPVYGPRDPFALPGMPEFPRVPTAADILKNRGYGQPWENPGVAPAAERVVPSHVSPELLRNSKVELPKFDPKPSFPTSSNLRWILYSAFLLIGGAFRAMSKERRDNA